MKNSRASLSRTHTRSHYALTTTTLALALITRDRSPSHASHSRSLVLTCLACSHFCAHSRSRTTRARLSHLLARTFVLTHALALLALACLTLLTPLFTSYTC